MVWSWQTKILLQTSSNANNETVYVSTTGSDANKVRISSFSKQFLKAIESGAETINIERGKYVEQFSVNTDKLILNAYGDSEDDVVCQWRWYTHKLDCL